MHLVRTLFVIVLPCTKKASAPSTYRKRERERETERERDGEREREKERERYNDVCRLSRVPNVRID
jgi:hypothetical protein